MALLYDVGLVLALLTGCAIGILVTAAHYEQLALRRWAHEKEVAEGRDFYATLAMLRRGPANHPEEHGVPLATRDARARGTYDAVGVKVIVLP
jgi:hypothetical protein